MVRVWFCLGLGVFLGVINRYNKLIKKFIFCSKVYIIFIKIIVFK